MYSETIDRLKEFTDVVEFERFSCDLLSGLGDYRGLEPQGVGRKDGGKDALNLSGENVVCHFSLRKEWETKLFEDLDTVQDFNKDFDEFVFVTNRRIPGPKKDKLKKEVRNEYGWDLLFSAK